MHYCFSQFSGEKQLRLINLKGNFFVLAGKKTPTGQTMLKNHATYGDRTHLQNWGCWRAAGGGVHGFLVIHVFWLQVVFLVHEWHNGWLC